MSLAELFTIAKTQKQPKCPSVDEWIKQLEHVHNGVLLSQKKEKIVHFVTAWIDLENMMLSAISLSEKNKHHMISLISGTY